MNPLRLRRIMNLWPPFLFSGIRVEQLDADWRYARVRLKLRWYNSNYVGTQYGGSLFSMTDPFWMILVMECLGRDYIVWDRGGEIDFVAPGRGDVVTESRVDPAVLDELRHALPTHPSRPGGQPWFIIASRDTYYTQRKLSGLA